MLMLLWVVVNDIGFNVVGLRVDSSVLLHFFNFFCKKGFGVVVDCCC
jgi:hypothetical protein